MNKFVKVASSIAFAGMVTVASIGATFAYKGSSASAATATPTATAECHPDRTAMQTALAAALGIDANTVTSALQKHDHTQTPWEALGVTQAEFDAAMTTVHQAQLADAVANGCLTQAQADEINAHHELEQLEHQIFGHDQVQAVLATLLGVDVAELADADVRQLVKDAGLDRATVQTAIETARTQAIDAAVTAGTITADQAEQLKAAPKGHGGFPGGGGRHGGGSHGGGRHGGGFPGGGQTGSDGQGTNNLPTSFRGDQNF
jgi:uncharacterized membrane protein YgcG